MSGGARFHRPINCALRINRHRPGSGNRVKPCPLIMRESKTRNLAMALQPLARNKLSLPLTALFDDEQPEVRADFRLPSSNRGCAA